MNLGNIKEFLGEDWRRTGEMIRSSLKSDINLLDTTNEAILSNSGKQLRPIVSLLCARACSGGTVTADSIRFAAAAELLHNATLLHDDVADNSSERRGRPSVMALLGGSASVLIGDFWLVRAMDNILRADKDSTRVIGLFSKTLSDLAEGEILQLQKAGSGDTDEKDYLRIIYSKTASLFETAAASAAISVGASDLYVEAVSKYAVSLGLAFQIRDDMFDYSLNSDQIGKPVGIDLDEQKITLPLLGALSAVPQTRQEEIRRMVSEIHDNPQNKEVIRDFVLSNGGLDYAGERLQEYVGSAVDALASLPESEERNYLAEVARFTADRKK